MREQGAKYSAKTGRLIPASSQALSHRNRQVQQGHPSARDGGAQASILEDQELLVSPTLEAGTAVVSASSIPGLPASTLLACLRVASPETVPLRLQDHKDHAPGVSVLGSELLCF